MIKSLLLFTFLISCQSHSKTAISTDKYIDINKYIGKWYAITSLPQRFTKGCLFQSAEYNLIDSQTISLINTCHKRNKTTSITGKAQVRNTQTNAELDIKFDTWWARLFNIKGDYNIMKIDDDYKYVLIGSKDRESLWIMSRTKSIPSSVLSDYIQHAKSLSFDVDELIMSKF